MKYLKTILLLLYIIHNSYIVNSISSIKMIYALDSTLDIRSLDNISNTIIASNIFINFLMLIGIL